MGVPYRRVQVMNPIEDLTMIKELADIDGDEYGEVAEKRPWFKRKEKKVSDIDQTSEVSKNDGKTAKKREWFKKRTESKPKKEKPVKEKPYDPDSFSERYRRWKLMTFDNYVILRTLSRDDKRGEYLLDTTLVKWSELPRDAVHCSGESKVYALDKIKRSEWYIQEHVNSMRDYEMTQFNATDAALHMKSNKFDNALMTHWNEYSHIDMKKIAILVIVVLAVLLLVITR